MTRDNNLSRLTRDALALGGMLPGKTDQEIVDILSTKVAEGMVDIGIAAGPVFENGGRKVGLQSKILQQTIILSR